MSNKPDGGPAFPTNFSVNGNGDVLSEMCSGLSMRDYFAAKALAGMQAHPAHERPQGIADWAYKVADAMLVERAKP